MSKFVTSIPVNVKAVAEALPGGCYLEKVVWNPESSALDLYWEHDKLETPFTYPLPFSFKALKENKLPKRVKLRPAAKKADDVRTQNAVAVGSDTGTGAQR